MTSVELGIGYTADYLILREASIVSNTAIAVKTYNDINCNGKVMMFALSFEQVETMKEQSSFNGINLTEMFGVPSRGYAGGMIQ